MFSDVTFGAITVTITLVCVNAVDLLVSCPLEFSADTVLLNVDE